MFFPPFESWISHPFKRRPASEEKISVLAVYSLETASVFKPGHLRLFPLSCRSKYVHNSLDLTGVLVRKHEEVLP